MTPVRYAREGGRSSVAAIRDPRVGLSVYDLDNPSRMAALEGSVVEVRPDPHYEQMDRIARKYTGAAFPDRSPGHICVVIAVTRADHRTLGFAPPCTHLRNGT